MHPAIAFSRPDHILAEQDLVVPLSESGKRFKRFGSALRRLLVDGGDNAPGTGFYAAKRYVADKKIAPAIFFKGMAAGEYEVWSESIHGKRRCEPVVEVIQ